MPGGSVRSRHSHADVAVGAMRGECLLAVENPMFPVEARSGLGACSITAGLGFGEAPCSELLAFRQRQAELSTLVFRSGLENMSGAERIVSVHPDPHQPSHPSEPFSPRALFC